MRLERLLDLFLVLGEIDFGLARQTEAVVVEDLLVDLVHGVLDDVGHHRLAIDLAQMGDRHLAGAEPVDAGLALHVGQLAIQPLGQIARRQNHLVRALEALREGFRHLHRFAFPERIF